MSHPKGKKCCQKWIRCAPRHHAKKRRMAPQSPGRTEAQKKWVRTLNVAAGVCKKANFKTESAWKKCRALQRELAKEAFAGHRRR